MRFRSMLAGLAVVAFAALPASAQENPYKAAKEGEYATFKMTSKIGAFNLEGTITQRVKSNDGKEVTLETSGKAGDQAVPPALHKVDVTKPFDPTKAMGNLAAGASTKMERLREGEETVSVLGKDYKAKTATYKLTMTVQGNPAQAEMKTWTVPEIKLPMVKMELTAEVMGTQLAVTMLLTEKGDKKDETKDEKK